jgi:transposase
VSQDTVYRAKQQLRENGKLNEVDELSTEEKRAEVREYASANPAASDREVVEDTQAEIAADLGVSQDTVYRAKQHHRENGKLTQVGELSTEEKRAEVRVVEDTQAEIAADLGVSEQTVGRAVSDLEDSGNQFQVESLSTEEKRAAVRVAEDTQAESAADLIRPETDTEAADNSA